MYDTEWDDDPDKHAHMSHDMPCPACGHAVHVYLPCGDSCDCPPRMMPGAASGPMPASVA